MSDSGSELTDDQNIESDHPDDQNIESDHAADDSKEFLFDGSDLMDLVMVIFVSL